MNEANALGQAPAQTPVQTLGQTLTLMAPEPPQNTRPVWVQRAVRLAVQFLLLGAAFGLFFWWLVTRPDLNDGIILGLIGMLVLGWILVAFRQEPILDPNAPKIHSLIADDRQGFMTDLLLDEKIAVIDGNSLYQFGRDNEMDAQVLGTIAMQLRREGYRVLCFFDANIFETLRDHGAFPASENHSYDLLGDIFGLGGDEVYVVPLGAQTEKYILNSLRYLPISFAITNSDYHTSANQFTDVMKGGAWRKGVCLDGAEIKLFKHKFAVPARTG